jgi:hypothetical protein
MEAQNALKEKNGKNLTLTPITKDAAEGYLRSAPGPDMGSINLDSGTLLWQSSLRARVPGRLPIIPTMELPVTSEPICWHRMRSIS